MKSHEAQVARNEDGEPTFQNVYISEVKGIQKPYYQVLVCETSAPAIYQDRNAKKFSTARLARDACAELPFHIWDNRFDLEKESA